MGMKRERGCETIFGFGDCKSTTFEVGESLRFVFALEITLFSVPIVASLMTYSSVFLNDRHVNVNATSRLRVTWPDLVGQLSHQLQFVDHIVLLDRISAAMACKPTLRTHAHPL